MISDAEVDAHHRQKQADADLDEDTADQIAKENP